MKQNNKQTTNQTTNGYINGGTATSSLTLELSASVIQKMVSFYADQKQTNNNPYIVLFAKTDDCAISIYTTNKVLFQGEGAMKEAAIWRAQETSIQANQPNQTKSKTSKTSQLNKTAPISKTFIEHGGSDEVGTGDYFGPVCVCACIVTQEQYEEIRHLGIDDSKIMDDKTIRQVAPMLRDLLDHSLLVLDNKKYNAIHAKYNMNGIKAMLHNQAYVHLRSKVGQLPELCIIDQFAPAPSYYRHLRDEAEVIRTLHFETKAESKYLAVACASVIARHAFLMAMDQLSEAYGMTLPKGAGSVVDKAGKVFVEKHGVAALHQVAKFHFANTKKIVGQDN